MSLVKDLAYKTLDVVTHGNGISRTIGGEQIRFPPRWSRYYEADYEPETFHFFHEYVNKGDTVLDIGAHIGLFAVLTAKLVGDEGRIFAFEPTPFTRSVLEEVVTLNGCSGVVEIRGEAVSSKRGTTVFYDTGNEISNANSLVRSELSQKEIPIDLISIDEFVSELALNVDCIKIDVEGAELDVLAGARETYLSQRPPTRLGLHPRFIVQNGQTLEDIWGLIEEYRLDVVFNGDRVDKDWFCTQHDLFDVNLLPS